MEVQSKAPSLDTTETGGNEAYRAGSSEKKVTDILPANEAAILEKQLAFSPSPGSFSKLYRFATTNDKIIVFISSLCAIGGGAAMPLMTLVVGILINGFKSHGDPAVDREEFNHLLVHNILYFIYLAIGEFVLIYVATVGFIYTSTHIASAVRKEYFAALLRQNIAFFDNVGTGEIGTRITADMNLFQDGVGHKVALTLTGLATFFTAFVVGFVKYWKLTLICSASVVAIMLVISVGGKLMVKYNQQAMEACALGGSVAEEILGSIRNATACGTQDKFARRYEKHLKNAKRFGFIQKSVLAVMIATVMCLVFLNYGFAFWMGSRFLVDRTVDVADILTIVLAVIIGAFTFGQIGSQIQAFSAAVAASSNIYGTIDRISPLDPSSADGHTLEEIRGDFEFRDVKHIYPSRQDVVVLENCNLHIEARKKTAIVGASGSGKSTIIYLLERFYEPVGGKIFLDGVDVSTLNLGWLRQQISLVEQEPKLFDDTIINNIKVGLIGTPYSHQSEQQQEERIEAAAKSAHAHDFIMQLPEGYQAQVSNTVLSGGQRQRIAIARAIVKDPKILLMDEPTSALDSESEGVVRAALEEASKNRTTVIVSHRQSIIADADFIAMMQNGKVVKQGPRVEMLKSPGWIENSGISSAPNSTEDNGVAQVINRSPSDQYLVVDFESNITLELEDPELRNGKKIQQSSSSEEFIESTTQSFPEGKETYSLWTLIKFITSFNKAESLVMTVGLVFAIIAGGGQPVQGVFFAKSAVALSRPLSQSSQIRSDVNFWSLMYLMIGIVQLLSMAIQGIIFAYCSEALIYRARSFVFRNLLRQDITFFDRTSTGALTSFLATEITHLAGLSSTTLSTLLISATTLLAAIVTSLAVGWKLALVIMSTIPVVLGCGFFRFWALSRFESVMQKSYAQSASYASERVHFIRTTTSLSLGYHAIGEYSGMLALQNRISLMSNLKVSVLYALSQSLIFLCIALGFWYGGTLIGDSEYSLFQFFVCFAEIIFSVQSAGAFFSFAGDMGKAHLAASSIKSLTERQPTIDTWGGQREKTEIVGGIEFRDVGFKYESRERTWVLRGLNFRVESGQYVALVGGSGCGKSTTILLLERLYDVSEGAILVDGRDIKELDINTYRAQLALVSQEPVLYQGSIRDNIILGTTKEDITDEEIQKACDEANIWAFIASLPDGLATDCGSKGVLLSGGQKQRIAIARALIRHPQVLLLDEATSALDKESEGAVQGALDRAAAGRTTIAIAHRLSTVQKADKIFVMDNGRVVESGNHEELIRLGGKYSSMWRRQQVEGGE